MGSVAVQLLWREFLQGLVPEHVFQLFRRQPQPWALFCALLLLLAYPQPGEHTSRLISSHSDLSYFLIRAAAIGNLHPQLSQSVLRKNGQMFFFTPVWWLCQSFTSIAHLAAQKAQLSKARRTELRPPEEGKSAFSNFQPSILHSLGFLTSHRHLTPITFQVRRCGVAPEALSISSGHCLAQISASFNGALYRAAFSYIIKQQL